MNIHYRFQPIVGVAAIEIVQYVHGSDIGWNIEIPSPVRGVCICSAGSGDVDIQDRDCLLPPIRSLIPH
jgi:hypothetical protein